MNFNEIPPLITEKQQTNNDGHTLQQNELKNMVIDELKSFFISRSENHQQQYDEDLIQQTKQVNSISSKTQSTQPTFDPKRTITNKGNQSYTLIIRPLFLNYLEQLNHVLTSNPIHNSERRLSIPPTFLISISLLTNILLNNRSSKKFSILLSDTLLYSTSFTFGYFAARCIKQTKLSYIHRFGNTFTRSLLLHTCLTLLAGSTSFSRRALSIVTRNKTISNSFFFIRMITSILHLIAGFSIYFDNKNTI
jgi:hypothetical protein